MAPPPQARQGMPFVWILLALKGVSQEKKLKQASWHPGGIESLPVASFK